MSLHARLIALVGTVAMMFTMSGCRNDGPVGPVGGAFELGQSLAVGRGREARILGSTTGGRFFAVIVNSGLDSVGQANFSLRANGVASPDIPPLTRIPSPAAVRLPSDEPQRDEAFENRLRDVERATLTPRFAAARQWNAARVPSLPSTLAVGDLVTVNVNATDPCNNPQYHVARVMAIGTKALVLNDTLNPKPGFTTTDFQRYAARFDTLIYPLDVGAFGEPTDIDKNGHIAIVFTRSVNELTQRGAFSFVGGLTFSRDLFPQVGTARAQACPSSNEGEYLYLMTPDPNGSINGNRRTNGFVDTNTTAVMAHELVHLINASRKLYVNTAAPKFEVKWLDEGLAHVAEELLFYKESGLSSRSNLTYFNLAETPRTRNAYTADMSPNVGRYREYLSAPSGSSPYRAGDDLSTRGATWSFLRYLADRKGSSDGDVLSRLVNSSVVGVANLQAVFGNDVGSYVRDWSAAQAVDDVQGATAELQQPSWNWHSIFGGVTASPALYPLPVTHMSATTASYAGTVVPGGSAFFDFTVPANGTASLTLDGQAGAPGSNLQLVIVRTE
ncbi:MAG TPA: hypothetical protein VF461_18325 [Gemmatimonadaceae bacterium]